MISKKKKFKPINIYMYICDLYDSELKYYSQRYSNSNASSFTDHEIMTIYLLARYCQKYFQVKGIHFLVKEYLSSWFLLLSSYQTFNLRLNRLIESFKLLFKRLLNTFVPDDCDFDISLVDSMPIITCAGKNREAKVARELVTKGFCSTKNQYYFGLKLYALTFIAKGKKTFPESIIFTLAQDDDLIIFKQNLGETISEKTIFWRQNIF